MRILFLSPFPPSLERPDALRHPLLLSREHAVTAVFLCRPGEDVSVLDEIGRTVHRVCALEMRSVESWSSCLSRAATRWPLYLAYYVNARLQHAIQEIARQERPDVVHAHTLRMAPYAAAIEAPLTVCNIQDVLTARYQRFATQLSARWPIDVEEWLKLRRFEPELWRRMHRIGVVSEAEASEARRLQADATFSVIRPGVDRHYFSPLPDSERTPSLVFVGRYSYRPNAAAALRAALQIFPKVKRQVPAARLLLVGSDPPPAVRRLSSQDGVTVVGRVDDIRPLLGRAAAALCPMTTGGGVKYKVLEALAMATPVATNALGARGIDVTHGSDVLIAERDDEIADACVRLLTDPRFARQLGEAGRDTVLRNHAWEAVGQALEVFHEPLAPGPASRRATSP